MASYDELILIYRLMLKAYSFRRYAIHPTPCSPLNKPLREARVALITTAGLHTPEQPGFDFSNKKGDCTFREIPGTVATQTLLESHRSDSFDHAGIEADRNLAFPLDRFHELVACGIIGELNHRHFSFMGSIVRPQMLIEETAPQVARMLRDDQVDAAFLTPV